MSKGNNRDFTCDCTGLEYYGKTCETRKSNLMPLRFSFRAFDDDGCTVSIYTAFLGRRIKNWFKPSLATMHKLYTGSPWLWKIVNNVPFLHKAAMRYVYLSKFFKMNICQLFALEI